MADARKGMLEGKNKILLFRLLKNSNEEAAKLAFQTSHSFTLSRDADSIVTKDGSVVKLGELEGEISGIEAVQAKDDPVAKMLQDSIIDGDKLEVWEVAVDEDLEEDGTYPALYAQGYLTEWEAENPAEDESRSEEHTSELQSRGHLVCRLLLEKKKKNIINVGCPTDQLHEACDVTPVTYDSDWGKRRHNSAHSAKRQRMISMMHARRACSGGQS